MNAITNVVMSKMKEIEKDRIRQKLAINYFVDLLD
jgi:hypothetical protein